MKATKLEFLCFPCRVVVCESSATPGSTDPETGDLREYASIVPATTAIGGVWLTRFEFAGAIEWTKHATILTDEQRAQIERCAAKYAAKYAEETAAAKALQARQRIKYADKIAKYGEDNA